MKLSEVFFTTNYTYVLSQPGYKGRLCYIHASHCDDGACLIAELWNEEGDDLAHPDELIFTEAMYLTRIPGVSTMHVTSCTSGIKLPAEIISKCRIRKFFLLPWLMVEYEGTNLQGPCTYTGWMRPAEVDGYSDNT